MKKHLSIFIYLLLLSGCGHPEEAVVGTTNSSFKLERLFTHDGCTVYRFFDMSYRYFTDCRGSVSWEESCGKNCTDEQAVETDQ